MKDLIIVVLLLLNIHLLNPSESDHRAAVRGSVTNILGINNKPLDAVLWGVSKEVVTVKDYFFFSKTYIGGVNVGYGVFGEVFLKDKLIRGFYNQ